MYRPDGNFAIVSRYRYNRIMKKKKKRLRGTGFNAIPSDVNSTKTIGRRFIILRNLFGLDNNYIISKIIIEY